MDTINLKQEELTFFKNMAFISFVLILLALILNFVGFSIILVLFNSIYILPLILGIIKFSVIQKDEYRKQGYIVVGILGAVLIFQTVDFILTPYFTELTEIIGPADLEAYSEKFVKEMEIYLIIVFIETILNLIGAWLLTKWFNEIMRDSKQIVYLRDMNLFLHAAILQTIVLIIITQSIISSSFSLFIFGGFGSLIVLIYSVIAHYQVFSRLNTLEEYINPIKRKPFEQSQPSYLQPQTQSNKLCPNCGEKIIMNQNFCNNCGQKVELI
ncbi:MAG: zinc ribbon domain-containing protein [Candidatus Hodarchaeales archaeon]|jgi:predicted RNA-binding Zn-ribbon protein involved in translation (DUF1610 family)